MASCVPTPSAIYSASVDDNVVMSCFLVAHDSRLVPVRAARMDKRPVLLHNLCQPGQS